MIFIDIEKAFDSVNHLDLMQSLVTRNVKLGIVKLLVKMYELNKTDLST